ncbi:VOC family protein [Streptomyces sp. NBC_00400]|uniref:VOC family protein n=1 Tax=Streptomyces sp. NBC_00400 TaxID=2975737 RepID=UPI002E1E8A56
MTATSTLRAGHIGLNVTDLKRSLAFYGEVLGFDGTVDEVKAFEARLRERGIDFAYDGFVAHGEGARSGGIFFHDPDGTRLEICVPSGAEGAPTPVAAAPACGFF